MREMHIRNLDLNLLVVFDAILREGSASAAAVALGMSQSGVSHALGRLREVAGDPLFLRKNGRLVPTRRAALLGPPVRESLATLLEALRTDADFDPGTARREFRLLMPDNAELAVLPSLLSLCERVAPAITFQVQPGFARGHVGDLLEGRLYLGVDLEAPHDEGLMHVEWLCDGLVVIARPGHPALEGSLDLESFSNLRHVLYHPPELSEPPLEALLRRAGIRRRIVARAASIGALAASAVTTEAVAIVTVAMASALRRLVGVAVAELPVETPPLRSFLWWSARLPEDRAHRWLREQWMDMARRGVTYLAGDPQ